MINYILKNTKIQKPFKTLFLCGAFFDKNDKNDKRIVLKNKIKEMLLEFDSIILEEHFVFKRNYKSFLSYDDIFMKNLHDIEMMMALLSDKIIIIHESISTAAELGIFASNMNIKDKLCVLIPHKYTIEEEKLSTFIKLAFLKNEKSFEIIEFYPVIKNNEISSNKKDYHTFFLKNEIGEQLSNQIKEFLTKNYINEVSTKINKSIYGNETSGFSYLIHSDRLNINIPAFIIELLIVALLGFKNIRAEVREKTDIKEIVNFFKRYIERILINTIQRESESDLSKLKVQIRIDGKNKTDIDLNKTIGYILYLFQARGLINLPKNNRKTTVNAKFTSSNLINYHKLLVEYNPKPIEKILNGIVI